MNISTLCRRAAVAIDADASLDEAALRMLYPYFGTVAAH